MIVMMYQQYQAGDASEAVAHNEQVGPDGRLSQSGHKLADDDIPLGSDTLNLQSLDNHAPAVAKGGDIETIDIRRTGVAGQAREIRMHVLFCIG